MTTKLFISYRSLDSAKVDAIVARLGTLKASDGSPLYATWQDKTCIPVGHDWWQSIVQAIKDCQVFVFMISEESAQNVNCRAELRYARQRNRPIIPLVLDGAFAYNSTTGKNDIAFWQHIPRELVDLRAQFLFHEGTKTIHSIAETVDGFQQEYKQGLWQDRETPDPMNPEDAEDDLALYDQACDFAHLANFAEAERLFDRLSRWTTSPFSRHADDWIGIMRDYRRLVALDGSPNAQFMFPEEWARYVQRFPRPFYRETYDPNRLGDSIAGAKEPITVALANTAEIFHVLRGHEEQVNSVAFSPDGHLLASGGGGILFSRDCSVRLWDVIRGEQVAKLQGHTATVQSVAFSPNGRLLASGADDRTIGLWDVAEQQQIAKLQGHTGGACSVAFSPDGRLLASGSSNNSIGLWDVGEQRQIARLQGHTGGVYSVVFSPDGRLLASGSYDETIRLWDVDERQQIARLQGHTNRVRSVVFSPDGRLLASGADDKTIGLWEVAEQRQIATLEGHTDWVRSVVFSPDGRLLASGADDQTIRLWDVTERQQIAKLEGHMNGVLSVVFSADGRLLASGSDDQTIRIWRL